LIHSCFAIFQFQARPTTIIITIHDSQYLCYLPIPSKTNCNRRHHPLLMVALLSSNSKQDLLQLLSPSLILACIRKIIPFD
jgi:hypothetical protein